MPDVEVVVPFQESGDGDREAALVYVQAWWQREHPSWKLTVSTVAAGPWCKALAVNPAIAASTADVVVVADADVICRGVADAVDALVMVPWAIPHEKVRRLTAAATAQLLGGAEPDHLEVAERVVSGIPGGGLVAARREAWLDCPFDPRFVGWGQEDNSLGYAFVTLHGMPWRGAEPLFHLWHQPQERMDRKQGNPAGVALRKRYLRARFEPDQMRDLIAEGRQT